jgi:hypothetical protein
VGIAASGWGLTMPEHDVSIPTIRLECVKLAHRHDLDPKAVVDRAAEFERYITGFAQEKAPSRGPRPRTTINPLS